MVHDRALIPGMRTNIVLNVDFSEEKIDVRPSQIYDVQNHTLILAQTTPPLSHHYEGNRIAVTFTRGSGDDTTRLGVYGNITKIDSLYRLHSDSTASALTVDVKTEVAPFNVRMHYRVRPALKSCIFLSIDNVKTPIIDISIGGALVVASHDHRFEHNDIIKIILTIDGEPLPAEARVVRIHDYPRHSKGLHHTYVALGFHKMKHRAKDILARKIRRIERETRFHEMYTE